MFGCVGNGPQPGAPRAALALCVSLCVVMSGRKQLVGAKQQAMWLAARLLAVAHIHVV